MLFLRWPKAADLALPAVGVERHLAPPPTTSFLSRAFRNRLLVLGRLFSVAGWTDPGVTGAALPLGLIISDVDDLRKLGLLEMDR